MISTSGLGFDATYQVQGGMIRNATIRSHGYGFKTRPILSIDDPRCRCGSYISSARIVRGGSGLTQRGRLEVYGDEGGMGFAALFETINGSLAVLDVQSRGSGYVSSATLRWQLICFNETTSLNERCFGGEELEFDVGLSVNDTASLEAGGSGLDLCITFFWADEGLIAPVTVIARYYNYYC